MTDELAVKGRWPDAELLATERALALAVADVERLQKQVEDARDLINLSSGTGLLIGKQKPPHG